MLIDIRAKHPLALPKPCRQVAGIGVVLASGGLAEAPSTEALAWTVQGEGGEVEWRVPSLDEVRKRGKASCEGEGCLY